MKKVLLMCITNKDEWLTKFGEIREIYRPEGKVFVFQNRMDDEDERIWITFNTASEHRFIQSGVIRVNRNKDTSTLFTIDAINSLAIRDRGEIDKTYVPNFREYENCLIINSNTGLSTIPLGILQTFNLR